MTDVIVIGAGHNSLTCAAYLARAGLQVVCLEAADNSGGMAATREIAPGYSVAGLTQYAHPLSPQICRDLDLQAHGYQPGSSIDTMVLGAAGEHLTVGRERVTGTGLSGQDSRAYPEFMQRYLEFAKALQPFFAGKPPRLKDMDFADKKTLARLGWNLRVGLGRESMYEFLRVAAINIYDVLNDAFENEQLKSCLAVDATMGSAVGPRTPGTVLTWLHRLQGALNGPLALHTGGESSLVSALQKSAEAAGVEIRYRAKVSNILVENDHAVGVTLDNGKQMRADLVVSGTDPRTTLLSLVGAQKLDAMFANRAAQIRGNGVVAKLNLALNELPDIYGVDSAQMANRMIIAPSQRYIEQAFNHSKYGEYSQQAVIEFSFPTLQQPSSAPVGHHILSANVAYAPYDLAGGWQGQREKFAGQLISQIAQYAPGLESQVVAHELLTPADIETQYMTTRGHWHQGELSIHQSMMLRPLYGAAQYNTPIDNLFLCSAGCHPGGDLTGLPGHNAAQRILDMGVVR